ncbi:MAG: glucuronate isomerase [Chthoniobacterales bacterium]
MKRTFIDGDFLLTNPTSRKLYHEIAKDLPIIDYHCHLPPADIATNRRFKNLHEIWLEGDHYKWRAMRSNGIAEHLCTGDASPREKFDAWAATTPMTLRNPLYHWSHLELQRYFDITERLSPATADSIWERANAKLAQPDFDVENILKRFRVELVCTTDDPADSLEHHKKIAASGLPTRVLPTFRPDKAMLTSDLPAWNTWCDALGTAANQDTSNFEGFVAALHARHDFFHETGCRMSDHGLDYCPFATCDKDEAAQLFTQARHNNALSTEQQEKFAFWLLREIGRWNHARGWVMQLHLGALRNNSSRQLAALGRDTGFDSINDAPQAGKLSAFLNALDRDASLPKTILYNLNPADNYLFATMIGNFNDGSSAGKIQFGSGWWFLDQMEGMTWQLNALSNLGLLSRFVGMLTDSRSFLSYPRHEYFRRILCEILGKEAETGILPDDFDLLADYIRNISYQNAKNYFPFWEKG